MKREEGIRSFYEWSAGKEKKTVEKVQFIPPPPICEPAHSLILSDNLIRQSY